jgi:glutathione S-transferase
LKVLLPLAEKKIPYIDHRLDLVNFEQHDPAFVKTNPLGQVPVLIHDGRTITESTVICEYLDAVFPEIPLRPKDEYWRAQMRIWTKFVDEYFCWCVSPLGWEALGKRVVRDMPEEEFEAYVARVPLHKQKVKWRNARTGFGEAVLAEEMRKDPLLDSEARTRSERAKMACGRRLFAGRHLHLSDGDGVAVPDAGGHERRSDSARHGLASRHRRASRNATGDGQFAAPPARKLNSLNIWRTGHERRERKVAFMSGAPATSARHPPRVGAADFT